MLAIMLNNDSMPMFAIKALLINLCLSTPLTHKGSHLTEFALFSFVKFVTVYVWARVQINNTQTYHTAQAPVKQNNKRWQQPKTLVSAVQVQVRSFLSHSHSFFPFSFICTAPRFTEINPRLPICYIHQSCGPYSHSQLNSSRFDAVLFNLQD